MNRNLDGVKFRIKKIDGNCDYICFSDLTEDQQDEVLSNKDAEWLRGLCKILAKRIRAIGDEFDILQDSSQRTGHWVYEPRQRLIDETDDGAMYETDYWCKCSECSGDFGYVRMKDPYCKYCGARMEKLT